MSSAETVLSAPPYQVSDSLRQRLDLIHHLIEFGRQVIIVTGAPGSGRSRLLEAVADDTGASWRVVRVDARNVPTPHALLCALTDAGGAVADQALEQMEDAFAATLDRGAGSGPRCLLLLDDVDDIGDDYASLLCRFAYGPDEHGGLRVVAAALPGAAVIERLEDLAPHPALVHVVDVPALDDADVAALIEAWCEDNRLPLEAVIDARALVALQAACTGNPGRALELLAQHMAAVPPRMKPVFSTYELPAGVQRVGGIAIVVCAAIALVALALGNRGTPHETSRTTPDHEPKTIELALPADATEAPTNRSVAPEPPRAEAPAPLPAAAGAGEAPSHAAKVDPTPPADAQPGRDTAGPSAQEPPRPAGAEQATRKPVSTPSPSKSPARQTAGAVTAPVAAPVFVSAAYTPEWVRKQDKKSFVIQLFGSHSRGAADKFVTQHAIASRAAILDLVHEGQPWYVVVYGHYPQRSAATQAITGLPAALRTGRPWPRAVGDLGN